MAEEKQTARQRRKAEREAKKQAKQQEKAAQQADPSSSGGGIRQWLIDSYNGVFKIVIQPLLPSPRQFALLILAFLFGMIWAYNIAPINYFNGVPAQLSQGQRDQYVILVAGAHNAGLYASENIVQLLSRVEDPAGTVERLINSETGQVQFALQQVQDLAQQAQPGTPAPEQGNIVASILDFLIGTIVFFIIIIVIALLWGLLLGGYVERFYNRFKPKTEADREAADAIKAIRERKEMEKQMKQEMAQSGASSSYGPPLMQKISPYTKGRAYDDSFAIEDANDMFLGECGATIAKTIGDGQDLTAVEVWLFDKEDFVRTYTGLLVSEHAYNDPVIRSELDGRVEDPETEIVVISPGAILTVESNNLVVQAKVADMNYGSDPNLPPNSHFDSLTLQMMAWAKEGVAAPAPAPAAAGAGGGSLPDLSSYEIGPPPEMPSGQTQPSSSGGGGSLPDLSSYEIGPPPEMPSDYAPQGNPPASGPSSDTPPPPPPPSAPGNDDDDDDPFGGTGDFTPIRR